MCLNLPPTVTSWFPSPERISRTSARLGPSGVLYFHKTLHNNKAPGGLQPRACCRAAPCGRSSCREWLRHRTQVITRGGDLLWVHGGGPSPLGASVFHKKTGHLDTLILKPLQCHIQRLCWFIHTRSLTGRVPCWVHRKG